LAQGCSLKSSSVYVLLVFLRASHPLYMATPTQSDAVKSYFRSLDKNGDGFIDKEDLGQVFGLWPPESFEALWAAIDENDDGIIGFDGFARWALSGNREGTIAFRIIDSGVDEVNGVYVVWNPEHFGLKLGPGSRCYGKPDATARVFRWQRKHWVIMLNGRGCGREENWLYKVESSDNAPPSAGWVTMHGSDPPPTLCFLTPQPVETRDYWVYVPSNVSASSECLVVVHGSPPAEDFATCTKTAKQCLEYFMELSEEVSWIVISPKFNNPDFCVDPDGGYNGYRALWGRHVGSDEYVHAALGEIASEHNISVDKFHLYGHSAGAQFANRYAVVHSHRLLSVVLSAPGRFAFPDPHSKWPYGQRGYHLKRLINVEPPYTLDKVFDPDPNGWISASRLRIHLVVGSLDTEPQPKRDSHPEHSTKIELAQLWIAAMRRLDSGATRLTMEIVPGVKHDARSLAPSVYAYFRSL